MGMEVVVATFMGRCYRSLHSSLPSSPPRPPRHIAAPEVAERWAIRNFFLDPKYQIPKLGYIWGILAKKACLYLKCALKTREMNVTGRRDPRVKMVHWPLVQNGSSLRLHWAQKQMVNFSYCLRYLRKYFKGENVKKVFISSSDTSIFGKKWPKNQITLRNHHGKCTSQSVAPYFLGSSFSVVFWLSNKSLFGGATCWEGLSLDQRVW